MFVILSEVIVKPGCADEALAFYTAPGPVEQAPGFLGIDFLKTVGSADGAEKFIGYTKWDSQASFLSYMRSEAYRQAASGGMPDFVESHKITMCERIASK